MTEADPDIWTPERRRSLVGLIEHLFPLDLPPSDLASREPDLAQAWIRALSEGPYTDQDALVAALLDELDERAGAPDVRFADAPEDVRETLLRGIEAEADPYLTHALRATLSVTLEQRLGEPERGGNPEALGWTRLGLSPEGPGRRLR